MKQKIIQKATALFLKLGFKSVTMDDIADEMAISKKTIYIHFKNKEALIRQCTFALKDHILSGIDAICSRQQNPIDELFEIKKFVMNQLDDDQFSSHYQLEKYYPEISKALHQDQFDKMMECTKCNLVNGIKQGLYRKNLNPDFIARLYFVGIIGTKDQKLFPVNKYSAKYITDEYLEYHLRGIVTTKGALSLNRFINENRIDEE